ncbi:MAG: hypothetical protein KDA91_09820 [Planctomycetaceae bacterium]|nr:hypothetical protein [Planctomycetaceae bacterium]
MKINVHIDSSISSSASDLIHRRCSFAFSRFESSIDEVFVTLTDENGPRGGESIRCVVRIQISKRPDIIIHEQCDTFERAVGIAIERAAHQVARKINRRGFANATLRRGFIPTGIEAVPA